MISYVIKIDDLLKLLHCSSVVTIVQIQKVTGWKPHSIRAAITGLRKKGHDVLREKNANDVTIYHIAKDA